MNYLEIMISSFTDAVKWVRNRSLQWQIQTLIIKFVKNKTSNLGCIFQFYHAFHAPALNLCRLPVYFKIMFFLFSG